jgi:hypothetical protein
LYTEINVIIIKQSNLMLCIVIIFSRKKKVKYYNEITSFFSGSLSINKYLKIY